MTKLWFGNGTFKIRLFQAFKLWQYVFTDELGQWGL